VEANDEAAAQRISRQVVGNALSDAAEGRTGGSNTFICPPSGASIRKYVSSLENCETTNETEMRKKKRGSVGQGWDRGVFGRTHVEDFARHPDGM